ncbi:MAG: hypothetical protein LBR36_00900 [Bacteroidales bacterium]|jgi:hypothetical protein|nr:hypothetical protein [Bacteroidales bacterium]
MSKASKLTIACVATLLGILALSCNKYDKMSILGSYEIDRKAILNLDVDSSKEVLQFNSGSDQTYVESGFTRKGNLDTWRVTGNFERKNNKITFSNRVKTTNADERKEADVTYKYRLEDNKLILIGTGEGYPNDEKVYTKKTS